MNPIRRLFSWYSGVSRSKRRQIFHEYFDVGEDSKILDLGSEDGANIARVLEGSVFRPENVYIADIKAGSIKNANEKYGFVAVLLEEGKPLPFADSFFDIVYCSSVLEHVTVPKNEIWEIRSGEEFRKRSLESQTSFANEIRRIGRQYFVQTPCSTFPLESHSWPPLLGILPAR